jgi:ABC-type multidrug transport system fused ATPase/permease subunit
VQSLKNSKEHRHSFFNVLLILARPYKKSLIFAFICAIVVGVFVAVQPILTKWIIDDGIQRTLRDGTLAPAKERIHYTMLYCLIFILVSAGRITVWMIGFKPMLRSVEFLLCDLRNELFRSIQRLCFRFHDNVSSGELFNYMMGSPANTLKMFLRQSCMVVPFQIVSWIVAVGILLSLNLLMTLVTLVVVAVVVFINRRSRKVMSRRSNEYLHVESGASKYVSDVLRGSRAVKVYAMEDTVINDFDKQAKEMRDSGIQLVFQERIEAIKPEAVQYAGMGTILLAGGILCIQESLAVGEFVAFITCYTMLMGPIITMLNLNLMCSTAEAGLARIMGVIDTEETTPDLPPDQQVSLQKQLAEMDKSKPVFEFKDVTFAYKHDDNDCLFNGLDCKIMPGETVALVGSSGSGKSTLVSLLMRLYEIDSGSIEVLGVDHKRYAQRELRSSFGLVPQDPFMFQDTIRQNVKLTNNDATDDEIREALDKAMLSDFINDLDSGLDTVIGEGGTNLSGGQKQRLAIARTLLSNATFYIFDEATSALDNVSERHIQKALESLMRNATSIIIAHRLSTVRNVDRILVFDQGRIVQDGTYEQLETIPGIFKSLVDAIE